MKGSSFFILVIAITLNSLNGITQDLTQDQKIWYSNYLLLKINKKTYFDNYLLNGYNASGHKFSFVQNDFAFNYKISNKLIAFVGVANYFYKWSPIYNQSYSGSISKLGTISYIRGSVGLKFKFKFLKNFEMDQSIGFQSYYPSLDKYQSRIVYNNQISFTTRKMPLKLTPYAQAGFFYYLNGTPSLYYSENGDYDGYYSSNGLHRMRVKFGVKMKPIKANENFGISFYYCIQKEFNLNSLGGHPLNTSRIGSVTAAQTITNPFNDYNIIGVQFNYIFSKGANSSTKRRQ